MSTFQEHCLGAVKDYLQTVLIIDDQAKLGGADTTTTPSRLQTPKASSAITGSSGLVKAVSSSTGNSTIPSHNSFDATKATNAFFESGVVAGLYRPEIKEDITCDDFANSAIKIASRSDVIIVDWMLKDRIPGYSKSLIKAIIDHDNTSVGGLRCIIVYTGESDIASLCDELDKYLKDNGDYELSKVSDYSLKSDNLIISFYNKENSGPEETGRRKNEDELPEVALLEFSTLVQGIIPAFAMKSAAKIRDNTGRIIAKFSDELDSGFIAHRALLPKTEDSEVFMLENFVSYLRNILAISQVDSKSLNVNVLEGWVDANYATLSKTLNYKTGKKTNTDAILSKEALVNILQYGMNFQGDGLYAEVLKATNESNAKRLSVDSNVVKFMDIFDKNKDDTQLSSLKLAVLTSFRRTYHDVDITLEKPYLTQGTLLLSSDGNYFLCVTPKCDTARVDGKRCFSFARMEIKEFSKKFDLVVPSIEDENDYIFLSCVDKFYELEHIIFEGGEERRVLSKIDDDKLVFTSGEKQYYWVGDLEDLQIQNRVSNLVGNINRVGLDEVELFRRKNR